MEMTTKVNHKNKRIKMNEGFSEKRGIADPGGTGLKAIPRS